MLFTRLYVRVGISPTCVISLRDKKGVWASKTNLTKSLFIDMSVPRQQNERPCDRGIEIASFYNFSIGFWKCSDSGIFLFCIIEFIF